jgi:hypothetical protein
MDEQVGSGQVPHFRPDKWETARLLFLHPQQTIPARQSELVVFCTEIPSDVHENADLRVQDAILQVAPRETTVSFFFLD